MHSTVSLYTRVGTAYTRVEFKQGKPVVPKLYDGMFYLRYTIADGKRPWFPFTTLDEALTRRTVLMTNRDRLREGLPVLAAPVSRPSDKKNPTIADAVADFVKYCEGRVAVWRKGGSNGLSPNSVVAYRKAMQDFEASCAEFGAVHVAELHDAGRGEKLLLHFNTWLDKHVKRKKGKGAYSDSRKFTVVGQFLARHSIKMKKDRSVNPQDPGIIKRQDVPRVKKPGVRDVVYYTPADLKAMLDAAGHVHEKSNYRADDLKDLVMVLLCTGMRDEEVQHLTWKDIAFGSGDAKMKITVQDKPQFEWRVKDYEKRIVTPDKNSVLAARLTGRLAGTGKRAKRHGSELLFPTSLGTPDQNFADRISALQKRAEATGYVFSRPETRNHILHNFRKSYATYQSLHGETPQNIQADLGHSELSTTSRYLARVEEPDKVRKAYDAVK